jgi:hypothetical protein
MPSGLYISEDLLLLLGVICLLASVYSMLRNLLTQQPFAALLPLVMISAAMIGYPMVRSAQYKDTLAQIHHAVDNIAAEPDNEPAAKRLRSLEVKLNLVTARALRSPADTKTVQTARLMLERTPPHEQLLIAKVEKYSEAVRTNPNDEIARRILSINLDVLRSTSGNDSAASAAIGRAQLVMGGQ